MDTASHSLVLLQQLNMQREFGFLCDCTVAIGDVYFKAHRAVLAAFSNYFKMIFIHQTSECIKIQPTDIQPDIFSYLLHIMYTGKGPKQIVDHSRLEEGIRFLHADYLSHIATEMNQVFSPETVQSSNLYGIQISTTQKTAVKPGLEVKEAPSNNSGNRAAVQGDHPQLQLSLAIGLDDGTADQQRAHPASQALEEHQKPPVSIKQERCDPESVISQSRPSPSSEVTGPTFTESGIKIHLCHYCGERFDSRSNLRQHLHTHVSGSLPFGVPASILESNDLGEVHPLNENSEALECRRLSSFIVKENEQQPDLSNRGATEPLQISQVSLISKDTEPVELNCNFSFSRKRKISCTICGHKFLRKSQLLEHMYTHKGFQQVILHKWIYRSLSGRRKTERENALPVSTSMFLLLLLLSRFSRVRLCATPPGSPVPGILQARTRVGCQCLLQCMKVKVKSLSRVQLLATPWTAAQQAPPAMGFSRHPSACTHQK